MTTETKNKPVDRVQVGQVKIAIFRNTDDEGRPYYSSALEHQYRDKDGNWKDASRYNQRELTHLAKAALLADSAILKLKTADRQEGGDQTGDEVDNAPSRLMSGEEFLGYVTERAQKR
jgi:hypothetical protein